MVRGQDGRRADEVGALPGQVAGRGGGREAAHPRHFQAAHSPPARLTDDEFYPRRPRHRALFQLNLHLTIEKGHNTGAQPSWTSMDVCSITLQ